MQDVREQDLDPRAQRTRRALREAVLRLMDRRPLADLSISDVVREAGVNRSSFYVHYSDLGTLLADALEEIALATAQEKFPDGHVGHGGDHPEKIPETVLAYMRHIADYADAYRWALGPQGSAEVTVRLRERFRVSLQHALIRRANEAERGSEASSADLDSAAWFLAGGMIGVIAGWLQQEPLPDPDPVARWLWEHVYRQVALLTDDSGGES